MIEEKIIVKKYPLAIEMFVASEKCYPVFVAIIVSVKQPSLRFIFYRSSVRFPDFAFL